MASALVDHPRVIEQKEVGASALVDHSQVIDSLLKNGIKLEHFLVAEDDKPDVDYDEGLDEEDPFPVVDMGPVVGGSDESAVKRVIEEIDDAFQKYGFVQIINHGVPLDVCRQMEANGLDLFGMPPESKDKAARVLGSYVGYSRGGFYDEVINGLMLWFEAFLVHRDPNIYQDYVQRILGDRAPEYCATLEKYLSGMEKVSHYLLELVERALGLEPNYLNGCCTPQSVALRLNYYPPSPNHRDHMGLPTHTDTHFITVSYQNNVGGRQHWHNNKWCGVKPREDALIIDVGDTLQAISNGRYFATPHRALVNPAKRRLSMSYFVSPRPDTIIQPAPCLVDKDHPAKYKPFNFKEYRRRIQEGRSTSMKVTTLLHEYLIENEETPQ